MPPPRIFEQLPEEIPEGGIVLRGTKYVVLTLLGKGAHGHAYLVRNPDLDRLEVMKILSEKVFDLQHEIAAEIVYRFKFEAQTLASIRNEHVVKVNDTGLLPDGRPYFTMDYSHGVPLSQRLQRGQGLQVREAVAYAIKMADGLAACHAKGVIHRDFKPANVLIGDDGAVTIIDFGVAKKAQEQGQLHGGWTQAGALLGTPAFMAPEQALGISDAIGPHTDVYALGTVIFVMLTGRLVFEGNTQDQIYQKLNTPEPTLLSMRGDVLPDLDRLVARMLAKDVRNRIQTASEVRAELQRIQKLLPSEYRVAVDDSGFDAPTMDARYDTAVRAAAMRGGDPTRRSGPPSFGVAQPQTVDAPLRVSPRDEEATADVRPSPRASAQPRSLDATTARSASRRRPPLWVGALLGIAVFGGGIAILVGVLVNRAPAETPSPTPSPVYTSTTTPPPAPSQAPSAASEAMSEKPATVAPAMQAQSTAAKPNAAAKQPTPSKPPPPEPASSTKPTIAPAPTTAVAAPPPPATTAAPAPNTTAPPKSTKGVLDDPF